MYVKKFFDKITLILRNEEPTEEIGPTKKQTQDTSRDDKVAEAKRIAAQLLDKKKPDEVSGLGLLVGQYRLESRLASYYIIVST